MSDEHDLRDRDDATTLLSVAQEWEATMIAEALSARGIPAAQAGGLTSGFRAEAPGMARVIVPRAELERAKAMLAEIRAEAADIDWDAVDVGEPEPDV